MRTFDKFFDLLNVRCFSEGKNRQKHELDHAGDKHLKVAVYVYTLIFCLCTYSGYMRISCPISVCGKSQSKSGKASRQGKDKR